MIFRLRNRHFTTWMALAVILPVGFVFAWKAIPPDHLSEQDLYKRPENVEATILSEDQWATVLQLRRGSMLWLEVNVAKPLTVPGAILYLAMDASGTIAQSKILGRIDSKKTYLFGLEQEVKDKGNYLIFYDPINKAVFNHIAI